jgi:hypothetical protein
MVTLKQALSIHVKTEGRMRLTRMATPTNMLKMASEYTGKRYRRGEQNVALQDLVMVLESLKNET